MANNHLTWLEISKSALLNNLAAFHELLGPGVSIMPIIKSNAYGHGILEVAKIVAPTSDWLGVVSLDEALVIRKSGIKTPILVLSFFNEKNISLAANKNIVFPVFDLEGAKTISRVMKRLHKTLSVHLKIDVGTTRLGILPKDVLGVAKAVKKLPGLKITGIFSHLADSENFNQEYTNKQIKTFNSICQALEKSGLDINVRHLACSAATIINPNSRNSLVRIGISLYGLWPSKDTKALYERHFNGFKLRPVLSWHTTIIQIKNVPINTYVGYGCTYKTKRRTKIAVLPIGYWDGYDRKLSNHGEALIRSRRARVLGRICMNMTMVDVTDIPGVRVGEQATLIGTQGKENISAEELAEKAGTINYEIVTRINPLLKRRVV